MKKIISILLAALLSLSLAKQCNSQSINLDSLWSVWNDESSPDSVRLIAISDVIWYGYVFTQPDSAFHIAQLQYDLAESIGSKNQMANALNYQGTCLYIKGNYAKSINYYTHSLTIRNEIGNKKGVASSLNNIGNVYKEQGDYTNAIIYYIKSLTIEEEMGNKKGISQSLSNIGMIYLYQNDYDNAINFYKRSLIIQKEIGDRKGIASSFNDIGNVYFSQANYKSAIEYYEYSLTIREEIDDKQGLATSFNNIGSVYEAKGSLIIQKCDCTNDEGYYDKAIDYYNRSIGLKEKIGDMNGLAISMNNISVIYREKGSLANAKSYGIQALKIAQDINAAIMIRDASYNLYEIYKTTKKTDLSLGMYELYITTRDSIDSEENQREVLRQEYKYLYDKQKAIDDKESEKKIAISLEQEEKQKVVSYSIAGGLALVLIFSIFIYNRLQVTRKQKIVIEEQKEIVEEKNQEIMDSITYAKRIQSAILPPNKVVKEYLKESFILYKPKDIVAGDFYWMEHKNGKVLFAAADCTGHGVPGAMVSVVCNNALNRSVREYGLTEPGKILDKTREIVIQEFEKSDEDVKDGMDIALCSLEGNKLHYAGAHNPLWIIRNDELIETKANKQPIGKFDNSLPYTTHEFELQKGDSIYIFSDGYVDQFGGEKGKKFKTRAFRELLLSIQDKSMEEQETIINSSFEAWKGSLEQIDDVCVIGVRV